MGPYPSQIWAREQGPLRLLPRTAVSGGKPLPTKKTKGIAASHEAWVLRMAAVALQRSRTALGAAFRRTARRKCHSVAVFALARKLATLVYQMLRYGRDKVDIGKKAYEMRLHLQPIASIGAAASSLGYELVPQEPVPA